MLLEHPLFRDAKLTQCQRDALTTLQGLVDGHQRIGILKGYAGTGKTFLTALLVKYLTNDSPYQVVVMTPTGRAAKVLEAEFDKHKITLGARTIHSVIYKPQPIDYSRDHMTLFADVEASDAKDPVFFIVDESSMVGGDKRERQETGLNFGSGSLLHDILEYANLRENKRARVLFVGDPGQLPPVNGREHSPALLPHELLTVLTELEIPNERIAECELNTVLRQNEGSLKNFVTEVRSSFENLDPLPRNRREQVNPIASDEVVNKLLSATERLTKPEQCVILAHRNADVYEYNSEVRAALNLAEEPLFNNEILLVRRNRRVIEYGELHIQRNEEDLTNGTFIQIVDDPVRDSEREVAVRGMVVTLRFWKATIRKLESDHCFQVMLIQNMLDKSFWDDYQAKSQQLESAILIDFQQRMFEQHKMRPPKAGASHYSRYKSLADRDPYLNALRVNYGYAVTVHNAQGGEWDTVIVDPRNPSREYDGVQHKMSYRRWVYTAATRARNELFFVAR